MSLKSRVEAVLFLTDKPVVAAVVAKLVNEDVQLVRQALLELIHDYEERDCALEIANDDDGYMMQVKDEYSNVANDLAPIDLPLAVVRTLSAIAIKQPVMQSDIVRIRGAGAYEHIKELLEKELIAKKEEGRSPLLSTTKKFQTYFRLSQDAKALRFQLKDHEKAELPIAEDQQLQIQDVQGEPDLSIAQSVTAEIAVDEQTDDSNAKNAQEVSITPLPETVIEVAADANSETMINEPATASNQALYDDDYITSISNEPVQPQDNSDVSDNSQIVIQSQFNASPIIS